MKRQAQQDGASKKQAWKDWRRRGILEHFAVILPAQRCARHLKKAATRRGLLKPEHSEEAKPFLNGSEKPFSSERHRSVSPANRAEKYPAPRLADHRQSQCLRRKKWGKRTILEQWQASP